MSAAWLWIFAVVGSALALTQSSLTAPLRNRIQKEADRAAAIYAGEFKFVYRDPFVILVRPLSKLISCPMCSGFWFGLAWASILGSGNLVGHGLAGSFVSATGVALWLVLVETHEALALWRYLSQPPSEEKTTA